MSDLISRQAAIDAVSNCGICIQRIVDLPPIPSIDAVNRQEAIDKIRKRLFETAFNNVGIKQNIDETLEDVAENRLENWFNELPSIQPKQNEMIKEIRRWINSGNRGNADYFIVDRIEEIINLYEIN